MSNWIKELVSHAVHGICVCDKTIVKQALWMCTYLKLLPFPSLDLMTLRLMQICPFLHAFNGPSGDLCVLKTSDFPPASSTLHLWSCCTLCSCRLAGSRSLKLLLLLANLWSKSTLHFQRRTVDDVRSLQRTQISRNTIDWKDAGKGSQMHQCLGINDNGHQVEGRAGH